MQVTVWSLPSLAAALMSVHTAFAVRRSRGVPGAAAVTALCACVFVWSLGQLLGTLTTDLEAKILVSKLQYPGIALLPVSWLAFALTYARRVERWPPGTALILLAIPMATIGLALSNEWHQLIWREVRLERVPGFVGLALDHGAWFDVHLIYFYALVAAGTLLLAYELAASPRHRRALAAVLVAPAIVVALNGLYLSGLSPLPFIDPTPLGFALATGVLVRGVLHTGLLDLSPSLPRQVLEQLDDPVIVLDAEGRIVDLNAAGQRLLVPDGDPATIVGAGLDRFLPGQLLARLAGTAERSLEIEVDLRTYHVHASAMNGGRLSTATTVLVFRDITKRLQAETELRQIKREMERLAFTDPLTGMHNRRSFMQRLHEECERVRRHGHALSAVLLDLDRFKLVNDQHGHESGDRVLREVARLIGQHSRTCDVAARLGGEEFVLLLPGTPLEGALQVAERLRVSVGAHPVRIAGDVTVTVTLSAGVACMTGTDDDGRALLRRADSALYRAKRAGRDMVCAEAAGDAGVSRVAGQP